MGGGFLKSSGIAIEIDEPPLSFCGQRLAKLVHQGRNPTLPYQALLTRESARLFEGFAPWCQ
jgi:hypothetical protein